jgi:cell division protein ZapA (FtsZ GTPase activity inhibitor)
MPILKVDILGSKIDINYEDSEKEKLMQLIHQFKKRLKDFSPSGKINNKSIIFLSALKAEDELEENKKKLLTYESDHNLMKENIDIISKLNNKIILLNSQIEVLKIQNSKETEENISILEKISNLQNLIELIKNKIKDAIN